jgi:hypothetical protein
MSNLKVLLTYSQRAKTVPYAAAHHADGTHNYGFTVLKGHLEQVADVEEARGVPCYGSLLEALNCARSPFFSIGCEKTFSSNKRGFWASGFIEFAFNYAELLGDASNYFSLFFHFNNDASAFIKANDIQFHWTIQPAHFTVNLCDGFTCAVWITTAQCATAKEARRQWDAGVACLSEFIVDTEPYVGAEMYPAVT